MEYQAKETEGRFSVLYSNLGKHVLNSFEMYERTIGELKGRIETLTVEKHELESKLAVYEPKETNNKPANSEQRDHSHLLENQPERH